MRDSRITSNIGVLDIGQAVASSGTVEGLVRKRNRTRRDKRISGSLRVEVVVNVRLRIERVGRVQYEARTSIPKFFTTHGHLNDDRNGRKQSFPIAITIASSDFHVRLRTSTLVNRGLKRAMDNLTIHCSVGKCVLQVDKRVGTVIGDSINRVRTVITSGVLNLQLIIFRKLHAEVTGDTDNVITSVHVGNRVRDRPELELPLHCLIIGRVRKSERGTEAK